MSFNIIVKNYDHYNRALGMHIGSKKQYFAELHRRGLVPAEEGNKLVKEKKSTWTASKDCVDMLKYTMDHGDKNKMIDLKQHPKLIRAMEKTGISFDVPDWCPSHYKEKKDAV